MRPGILLVLLLAACAAQPPAVPAPVTEPAPAPSTESPATVEAPPGLGDPAWLSDTLAFGTVMLQDGQPAAAADVYVGIAEGVPGEPGDCTQPRNVLGLTRTAADAHGRWRTRIPRAERGSPGCLHVVAEVRDTAGPVWDSLTAFASVGVDLDSMPVRLVLETVEPREPDPDAAADPRPDFVWPRVAEQIPGWAGWINGPRGCDAIVSLKDMGQREAARAYVEAELRSRQWPGEPACEKFDLTFKQVSYGWADLVRWSGRAAHLYHFRGIEAFDVDEVANRLYYRYRDAVGARAARRALAVLRVPPGAIEIGQTEDAEQAGGFGPARTLLGRALIVGWDAEALAWSADSREVLYLHAPPGDSLRWVVRAVDAATRRVRQVAEAPGYNRTARALAQAADGSLYVGTWMAEESRYGILRVRPGQARPAVMVPAIVFPRIEMDSAGRRFAGMYRPPREEEGTSETLVVWDAREGWRREVPGGGTPWGMSPDGRALAYELWSEDDTAQTGLWIHDLERRRRRRVWKTPADETEHAAALRWVDGAPRLLIARRPAGAADAELLELDPATGRRTRLGAVPAGGGTRAPAGARWTPDGRRAAFWVTVAMDPPGCITGVCDSGGLAVSHSRLYLWEAGVPEARLLAETVLRGEEPGWFAFSPDGARLGYRVSGTVYVHDRGSGPPPPGARKPGPCQLLRRPVTSIFRNELCTARERGFPRGVSPSVSPAAMCTTLIRELCTLQGQAHHPHGAWDRGMYPT